ncbi:MAG: hypothetical protein J6L58_04175 [Clostridia bacterium]|nr:hypothetical protein [Clostridia bacterium]
MEEIKNTNEKTVDIMQLVRAVWAKWYIVVVAGILAAAICFVYSSFFITPLYKANSTMLVDLRNSVHDDLSFEKVNVAEKYVSTLAYVMKTNTVLEPVIEELNLNETVSSLASKITVSTMSETLLIKVSIQHPNPKKAVEIIKAIGKTAPEIINQRITAGYITEIEAPSVSSSPVSPDITKNTLVGGAAGAFLAAAVIIALAVLNNRVMSVADLQNAVDLPLLGVIPALKKTGKE